MSFGTKGLQVYKYSSKVVTVPWELLQDSTGTLLEDPTGRQIQIPTTKNAKTLTLPLHFDPKLPWYKAAKAADAKGAPVILRAKLPGGEDTLYWYGYMSFDGDPSITSNTPMGNTMTFTALSDSTLVEGDD